MRQNKCKNYDRKKLLEMIEQLLLNPNLSEANKKTFLAFKNKWSDPNREYINHHEVGYLNSMLDRYSDKNIEKTKKWEAEYDEEKRNLFNDAVKFYGISMKYDGITYKAQRYDGYIPTESAYKALTTSPYFLRSKEQYKKGPKYQIGDLVLLRKNNYMYRHESNKGQIYMIEKVNDYGYRGACYWSYTLMVLGTPDTLCIDETELVPYRERYLNKK